MENIIFYIYTIIKSDKRYSDGDKAPIYATLFLISFFQLSLILPFALLINSIFSITSIKLYLSQSMGVRYLIIFSIISVVFFINLYLFGNQRKISSIDKRFDHKRERYLKYKWLLMLFPLVIGGLMLVLIQVMRV